MFKRVGFALLLLLLVSGLAQAQLEDVNVVCYQPGYLAPRLVGGMYARVVSSQPLDVHEDFSTSSPVVGQVEPGAVIPINSAPRCENGVVWWQSNFRAVQGSDDTPFGWLPEGMGGEYWLEPAPQSLNVPANRQPISAENLGQLQPLAQVAYGMVNDLVWSADGAQLAISTVGAVWVHDLDGGPALALKPNGVDTNLTSDTTYSRDGSMIATAGTSANTENAAPLLNIWSLATGQPAQSMIFPLREYGRVAAVNADFSLLAAAGWDGSISLWELPVGTLRAVLEGHTLVGLLEFTPDGQTLVSAGSGGMMISDTTVRVWDVITGTEKGMIDLGNVPNSLALSPNGSLAAVPVEVWEGNGNPSFSIQLVDTAAGTTVRTISLDAGVSTLSFDLTGRWLVATSSQYSDTRQGWDGRVMLIDVETGLQVSSLVFDVDLRRAVISPDGTLLAVAYADPDFWGPDRVALWAVP